MVQEERGPDPMGVKGDRGKRKRKRENMLGGTTEWSERITDRIP